ncbi:MAG: hypothetical protein IKF09_04145, partial [Clostridiales bacterium]|nr:hypothetical protein [Clostridiales bacterium]
VKKNTVHHGGIYIIMKYSFKRKNEISLRDFEEQMREQERILRGSAGLRGTDSCTSVRTLQQDLSTVVMRSWRRHLYIWEICRNSLFVM